jgi:hypothetical protein
MMTEIARKETNVESFRGNGVNWMMLTNRYSEYVRLAGAVLVT